MIDIEHVVIAYPSDGPGLHLLSGRTSYRKISGGLEAARFLFTFSITLKLDRHLGSSVAELPAKFQSDTIIITSNLATHEILR